MSKLLHEMVFNRIDHLLELLVWTGTILQIAVNIVYDWISWMTINSNVMVDSRSTSAEAFLVRDVCMVLSVLIRLRI